MSLPSILHIDTGRRFRGGQRQLVLLAQRLHEAGVSQIVACPTSVHCASGKACPQDNELSRRLKKIPTVGLSTRAIIRKFHHKPLKQVIAKHSINIIHAHDSEAHTIGMLLKRSMPDLKLVVNRRVIFPPSGILSRRFKYGKHVDRFIAISKAVKRELMTAGVDDKIIEVIPSGLDREEILNCEKDAGIRKELGLENNFIIVTAGALTREKAFRTAIESVWKIAERKPEVSLLILGDGPQLDMLERLAGEKPAVKIIFAGFREPMAPIFKACDLFIMTSVSEGLNTSAIEAAACGLPLVVSDVGGLPEIAENQSNGIVCRSGDAGAFASAVISLMDNDGLRGAMSRRSIEKSAAFDIAETAKKTMGVYNQLLDGRL